MKDDCLAFGVYAEIKKEILSLAYPPGSILQERQLAERFGVSRTPVREAIQRLSQEGWLTVNARRNIRVRDVSTLNLRKLFLARLALEEDAVDLVFAEGLDEAVVRRMKDLTDAMHRAKRDLFAFISTDQSFHSTLFAASGNEYLQRFWLCVSEDMIWFGMLAMDERRYDDVLDEHGAIVRALEKRHKDAVKAAIRAHLDCTRNILVGKMRDEGFFYGANFSAGQER